ncbi:MAG TPA: hypothetical protein VGO55_15870 [Allosphingosinicella sp.]|jgi:hypothetical protein|nr:hypothetical protein [Allosphingosinicella sp.]
MKSLTLAAAALLFSTSALAFAPSTEPAAAPAIAKDPFVVSSTETMATVPFLQTASASTWDAAVTEAGDPDLDLAVDPDAEQASLTGMGGPEEPVDVEPAPETLGADDVAPAPVTLAVADVAPAPETTLAAAIAPRPAEQNYPACRPGPGDDNCIQLYEPGVRLALASWTQPTGGLADGTQTAMGGPYEPVDEAAGLETAMAGDGVVDAGMGEMAKDETVAI